MEKEDFENIDADEIKNHINILKDSKKGLTELKGENSTKITLNKIDELIKYIPSLIIKLFEKYINKIETNFENMDVYSLQGNINNLNDFQKELTESKEEKNIPENINKIDEFINKIPILILKLFEVYIPKLEKDFEDIDKWEIDFHIDFLKNYEEILKDLKEIITNPETIKKIDKLINDLKGNIPYLIIKLEEAQNKIENNKSDEEKEKDDKIEIKDIESENKIENKKSEEENEEVVKTKIKDFESQNKIENKKLEEEKEEDNKIYKKSIENKEINNLKGNITNSNRNNYNNQLLIKEKKINELNNLLNQEKNKNKYIFEKINELEKLVKPKINENESLSEILKRYPFVLLEEERMMSIIICSFNQEILTSFICKNTDLFVNIELKLYEKYPKYKESENYFIVNGIKVNKYKSLEENNIKDSDIIILNPLE